MSANKHTWEFRARFRRNAFGWKSQPAITRIKEAVSEIRKVAKKDPTLGAEGAVLFLEKLSPAIEHVDSSSGSIGTAVGNAIDALVPVIAQADVDVEQRQSWLERLWAAIEEDEIPYLETLGDRWGELCVYPLLASRWADEWLPIATRVLIGAEPPGTFFIGTAPCLSALFAAGRHEEILALITASPYRGLLDYRVFAVRALAAMGRLEDALVELESGAGRNDSSSAIARIGEEILIGAGQTERAFQKYGFEANQKSTFLATYRALQKKYPSIDALFILSHCIEQTPDEEGKWFAAARHAGFLDIAARLAAEFRTEPLTLINAARDHAPTDPEFAIQVGIAALEGIDAGYGYYEPLPTDVLAAYDAVMLAARVAGTENEVAQKIHKHFTERRGFVSTLLPNIPPSLTSSVLPRPTSSLAERKAAAARETAQQLIYQAWEARTKEAAVALARKALKISPDCADAYNLLAQYTARSFEQALALYTSGVEAGRRALGEKLFEDEADYFWGMLETRPFMRSMAGLSISLWNAGRKDESISHLQEMLRLNPNDNQGIRYLLLPRLIECDRDTDANSLMRAYDDAFAGWLYARVLLDFRRHGDGLKAKRSLKIAMEQNGFVPSYLTGRKNVPRVLPPHYGIGDESEAIVCVSEILPAWRCTPGALEWLAAAVKRQL
jgi:tetratricopeptide (TPR) repeat protein